MFAPVLKYVVCLLPRLVTVVERPQTEDGESFSSQVVETTEVVVEEKQMTEKDIQRVPAIPQQLPFVEVLDDWFELLDVTPRKAAYVPPGIAKAPSAFLTQNILSFLHYCTLPLSPDPAHQLHRQEECRWMMTVLSLWLELHKWKKWL